MVILFSQFRVLFIYTFKIFKNINNFTRKNLFFIIVFLLTSVGMMTLVGCGQQKLAPFSTKSAEQNGTAHRGGDDCLTISDLQNDPNLTEIPVPEN